MSYIYPLVFISASLLGSFGFIEKYYFLKKLQPLQLALLRNIIVSLILIIVSVFLYFFNNKDVINYKKLNKTNILFLILYCIIYTFVLYNFFNGIKNKPAYKINITIQISSLISNTILGYFIFNEEFTNYNIIGIIFAFISLCLMIC